MVRFVIPANAGIQTNVGILDSGFHRNDTYTFSIRERIYETTYLGFFRRSAPGSPADAG
jgi:hypothetical protein